MIEFESKKEAINTPKHINYIASVLGEYYNGIDSEVIIDFIIIYGPEVSPVSVMASDFRSLQFNPQCIYLRDTNKEILFDEIKNKIKSKEPLTRLQLLRLFMLPESMKCSKYKFKDNEFFNLLQICLEYGSDE